MVMTMAIPTFEATRADYSALLMRAQVKPGWVPAYERAADYIVRNRARYESVARRMGTVPWQLIGCLHWREAEGSFAGVLHNGEKILGTGRKTRLAPAGRGPFSNWEEAAIDALRIKGLEKIGDWPLERVAYEAERFNGFGYRMHYPDVKSPYLWAGTNNYTRGKYTSDGHFDRSHTDQQIGVMALYQMVVDRTQPEVTKRRSFLQTIIEGIKWLAGAVGSLFTLDSLGTLQSIHDSLSGVFTVEALGIVLGAGTVIWAVIKILEKYDAEKEQKDVGPTDVDGPVSP